MGYPDHGLRAGDESPGRDSAGVEWRNPETHPIARSGAVSNNLDANSALIYKNTSGKLPKRTWPTVS